MFFSGHEKKWYAKYPFLIGLFINTFASSRFFSFVPHCNHPLTATHSKSILSFISVALQFIQSYTCFFLQHKSTQVKWCSSVVPFCSAKTYLQGYIKLPTVALAYNVHLPGVLRSGRCSTPAVHLFCFTHSLHPHSQLFHHPKPQQGVRKTHIFLNWGAVAAYYLCSPAGRCGLIGLSCFLHFSNAFSRFFPVVRSSLPSISHFQQPTQE